MLSLMFTEGLLLRFKTAAMAGAYPRSWAGRQSGRWEKTGIEPGSPAPRTDGLPPVAPGPAPSKEIITFT